MEYLQAKVLSDACFRSQRVDDAFYDDHACEWLQVLLRWRGVIMRRKTGPLAAKRTMDPRLT